MNNYMVGVEAFHKARKSSSNEDARLSVGATSNAVVIFNDNTVKVLSNNQACYAGLAHLGAVKGLQIGEGPHGSYPIKPSSSKRPEYVLGGIQGGHERLDMGLKLRYLDWILNHSVWSDAFVTKDPQWCMDNECVVASAHVPSNIMVGGLVAIRHMWEYSHRVYVFDQLYQAGVQPELAFWIGCCANLTGDRKGVQFDISYDNNHDSINASSWRGDSLLNWLLKSPVKSRLNKPYSENLKYRGYCDMFTPEALPAVRANSKEKYLVNMVLPKHKAAKCFNPFAAAKPKQEGGRSSMPLQDVVEHIVNKLQYTIYEDIGYAKSFHSELKSAIR